jgi:HigB_toxin, RelE-like toxic component of a toxin-antitoxin system
MPCGTAKMLGLPVPRGCGAPGTASASWENEIASGRIMLRGTAPRFCRDIVCVAAGHGEVGLTPLCGKPAATWPGAFARSRQKFRLVASVRFHYGAVHVRFIGTHRAYDTIDPQTI